jgi:hypothetical protein
LFANEKKVLSISRFEPSGFVFFFTTKSLAIKNGWGETKKSRERTSANV